jgi:hypothetical protein
MSAFDSRVTKLHAPDSHPSQRASPIGGGFRSDRTMRTAVVRGMIINGGCQDDFDVQVVSDLFLLLLIEIGGSHRNASASPILRPVPAVAAAAAGCVPARNLTSGQVERRDLARRNLERVHPSTRHLLEDGANGRPTSPGHAIASVAHNPTFRATGLATIGVMGRRGRSRSLRANLRPGFGEKQGSGRIDAESRFARLSRPPHGTPGEESVAVRPRRNCGHRGWEGGVPPAREHLSRAGLRLS